MKVKNAETEIKLTYADIVKSFDTKLQIIADAEPQIRKPGPGTYLSRLKSKRTTGMTRAIKNLIAYGIPEYTSDDGSNRRMQDQVHFQTICQEGIDLGADVIDTIRLGEKKDGRSRPLMVNWQTKKNTFIGRDMSPLERKEDYELRTDRHLAEQVFRTLCTNS